MPCRFPLFACPPVQWNSCSSTRNPCLSSAFLIFAYAPFGFAVVLNTATHPTCSGESVLINFFQLACNASRIQRTAEKQNIRAHRIRAFHASGLYARLRRQLHLQPPLCFPILKSTVPLPCPPPPVSSIIPCFALFQAELYVNFTAFSGRRQKRPAGESSGPALS